MEIDENLARSELSPAEEAACIMRRKVIWEKINGPAKAIGARAANVAMGNSVDANAKSAFASATVTASGKSLRSIQVAAQRGAGIGPDITRIVGTSLDKGVEMDALIKLPEDSRADLIERAASEPIMASNKKGPPTLEEAAGQRPGADVTGESRAN